LGFDALWYADFYHHLAGDTDKGSDYAKLVKTCGLGDDRPLAMDYFAGALAATAGRTVVYPESHDEAGNGAMTHRSLVVAVNGAPLVGDTRRYAEARCRVAAGLAFFSAGVPMFLFGEEVGMTNDFLYGRVLESREDLHGLRAGSGEAMFAYYRDAIGLRLENEALRSKTIEVVYVHNEHRLLAFRRHGGGQEFLIIASLNNLPFNSPGYTLRGLGVPDGAWTERLNSDSRYYGGDDVGNGHSVLVSSGGELSCVVPANGILVLMRRQ
jgi:1,4-alpha-glucan branching enzyme